MLVSGPVIADRRYCVLGISQTALVGMQTRRRVFIRTTIASPESLANDKGPVHDDAEISVSPAQAHMSKCVLGWNGGRFFETGWDVL